MERGTILDKAKALINTARCDEYGRPEDNFATIAGLWTAYMRASMPSACFAPHDVAVMMALLKIGRIATGTQKEDSYADLAGYAALACDLKTAEDGTCSRNA